MPLQRSSERYHRKGHLRLMLSVLNEVKGNALKKYARPTMHAMVSPKRLQVCLTPRSLLWVPRRVQVR